MNNARKIGVILLALSIVVCLGSVLVYPEPETSYSLSVEKADGDTGDISDYSELSNTEQELFQEGLDSGEKIAVSEDELSSSRFPTIDVAGPEIIVYEGSAYSVTGYTERNTETPVKTILGMVSAIVLVVGSLAAFQSEEDR